MTMIIIIIITIVADVSMATAFAINKDVWYWLAILSDRRSISYFSLNPYEYNQTNWICQ